MSHQSPEFSASLRRGFYQLVGLLTIAYFAASCSQPEASPSCQPGTVTHLATYSDGSADFSTCSTSLFNPESIPHTLDTMDPSWSDPAARLIEPSITVKEDKVIIKKAEVDGTFHVRLMLSDGSYRDYTFTANQMSEVLTQTLASSGDGSPLPNSPEPVLPDSLPPEPAPTTLPPATQSFPPHTEAHGTSILKMTAEEKDYNKKLYIFLGSVGAFLFAIILSMYLSEKSYYTAEGHNRARRLVNQPSRRQIDPAAIAAAYQRDAEGTLAELSRNGSWRIIDALQSFTSRQETAARMAENGIGIGQTSAQSQMNIIESIELAKGQIDQDMWAHLKGLRPEGGINYTQAQVAAFQKLRDDLHGRAERLGHKMPAEAFPVNRRAKDAGFLAFWRGAVASAQDDINNTPDPNKGNVVDAECTDIT